MWFRKVAGDSVPDSTDASSTTYFIIIVLPYTETSKQGHYKIAYAVYAYFFRYWPWVRKVSIISI